LAEASAAETVERAQRLSQSPNLIQQAKRALKYNFPGITEQGAHEIVVDGIRLWHDLLSNIEKLNTNDPAAESVGKLYDDKQRENYMSSESQFKKMRTHDITQPLDREVEATLTTIKSGQTNWEMWISVCATGACPNQFRLARIFKFSLKLHLATSSEAEDFASTSCDILCGTNALRSTLQTAI